MVIGSGNKITESRPVSGFDRVELSGIGKLVVRQNGTESLTIEGDDNIVPLIRTEASGGTLRIGLEKDARVNPRTPLVFTVTARNISALGLSGAGSIEAGEIKAGDFETVVSGAGHASLSNLTANNLSSTLYNFENEYAAYLGQARALYQHYLHIPQKGGCL